MGSGLIRVTRRLERLEARAMAIARDPIVFRILLVHPEKGLTGVLLIDSDQSTTSVPATAEEVEFRQFADPQEGV